MTAIGGVRQGEAHVLDPFALHWKIVQDELIHVRDQIGFPISIRHVFIEAQIVLAIMKAIAKVKRVTENEIVIVKNIDHARTGRTGKDTNRLGVRAVEVLI